MADTHKSPLILLKKLKENVSVFRVLLISKQMEKKRSLEENSLRQEERKEVKQEVFTIHYRVTGWASVRVKAGSLSEAYEMSVGQEPTDFLMHVRDLHDAETTIEKIQKRGKTVWKEGDAEPR